MSTIIVGAGVLLLFGLAIAHIVHNRKEGRCASCEGCSGCSLSYEEIKEKGQ